MGCGVQGGGGSQVAELHPSIPTTILQPGGLPDGNPPCLWCINGVFKAVEDLYLNLFVHSFRIIYVLDL